MNPLLGPLSDNGGAVPRHLPQPGSPAIDTGEPAGFSAADQRDAPRSQDGDGNGSATVDGGSVEDVPLPDWFIATASFGRRRADKIEALRGFRDRYLRTNAPGRFFLERYDACGPRVAERIEGRGWPRGVARVLLMTLVGMAWLLA